LVYFYISLFLGISHKARDPSEEALTREFGAKGKIDVIE
jgi:hypothetical protein